jgi:hypothetical protein
LENFLLKALHLRYVDGIKVAENLPFLSEVLIIAACEGLERVPSETDVERLDSLHQLFLDEDMQDVFSQWLPGLHERHQHLHREDLDVYNI